MNEPNCTPHVIIKVKQAKCPWTSLQPPQPKNAKNLFQIKERKRGIKSFYKNKVITLTGDYISLDTFIFF